MGNCVQELPGRAGLVQEASTPYVGGVPAEDGAKAGAPRAAAGRAGRPMTGTQLLAAAEGLEASFARFAPLFGKAEARRHAYNYVRGLMICQERKSIEPIAMATGQGKVSGLQKFINIAPWRTGDVLRQMQAAFAERFTPAPGAAGTIGVLAAYSFPKKGSGSAGVAKQVNPRTCRSENCQVGVFLNAVATGAVALMGLQLYLPPSWWEPAPGAQERREKVHVPKGIGYLSRPQLAADLVRRHSVRNLVRLDWVTAAESVTADAELQTALELRGTPFVLGVPLSTRFWVEVPTQPTLYGAGEGGALHGGFLSGHELLALLRPGSWRAAPAAPDGSSRDYAAVRVRYGTPGGLSQPSWLLLERQSGGRGVATSAFLTNAQIVPSVEVLAAIADARARTESYFDEANRMLGMAQYETRSWVGWHHHITLVGLAHLLVTLSQIDSTPSRDGSTT